MFEESLLSPSHLGGPMEEALDKMFLSARTYRVWKDRPVAPETLRQIYETMKFGPTAANASPLRILFLTSKEAKERLIPAMAEGNREKTRTAPVVAVFAADEKFFEKMEELWPGRGMDKYFAENPEAAQKTATQSATLQAAYFITAARAYGLDCGPMAGYDGEKVDAEFFSDSSWRVLLICNLGHGDPTELPPRQPRLSFSEVCTIL